MTIHDEVAAWHAATKASRAELSSARRRLDAAAIATSGAQTDENFEEIQTHLGSCLQL
jgi:hypothetical protein